MAKKDKNNAPEEEIITSSGSGIAQVDDSARGRRGLRGKKQVEEEVITSSGSGIAQVDDSARGRRGLRGKKQVEEEVITSSGSGIAEIARPRGRAALNNKGNNIVRKQGDLPEAFILRGKTYKTVKLISASTAEARVILVERDNIKYALKLYYANMGHGPDPEVLRVIKDAKDEDYLIKIYDFGVWVNPENPDEECDYELMQYCEGGALKPGSLHGDREKIIDVTVQMLQAAIDCANLDFIHRDIKPENFLWVDKEHTKLVLSDFGFAVPCPDGESVWVEDHRTKIYTAPEFYLRAPGLPAKVDHRSDVYSVGLSMLTLWSGEEVMMGHTETQLIEMKSQEKLPYPDDMDSDVLMLLKGLTRGRPDERWDNDTVLRWNDGELDEDDKHFANAGEIEIVFDSSKGLVAHSRGELADMMIANQAVAKKFLYSGRIAKWLDDAGLRPVAVEVENIVENVYPKNQEAGLWSVIYLLSPSAPYYFPGFDFTKDDDENQASSLHDLGVVIWNNVVVNADQAFLDRLAEEFATSDTRLALYLDKENRRDLFQKVKSILGVSGESSSAVIKALKNNFKIEAIWYLIYALKPDLPWVMKDTVVETVEELLDQLKDEGVPLDNMKYEAFVEWLLPRDPVLAAKVKNVRSQDKGADLQHYYYEPDEYDVAYALSPYMDYHFSHKPDDKDRVFTPEELAESLNEQLFIDFDNFVENTAGLSIIGMEPVIDESAFRYLLSKGKYDDLVKWIDSCYDEEETNQKKYGPYDGNYAAFKILKGLAGGKAPFYEFPDGTRIRSLEEMRKIDKAVLKDALENGALAPWIATFYQEDPYADLKPEHAYEKLTVKYLDEIGHINPENADYDVYKDAEKQIDKAVKKASNGYAGMKFTRYFMLPLLAVLFIFVAVLTAVKGIPDYNPVTGHYVGTAIALSVVGIIIMFMGEVGFFAAVIGGLLIGFLGALLFSWCLDFAAPWLTWIYLAIVIAGAVWMFVTMKRYLNPPYVSSDAPDLRNPGFGFRELEALHHTYKFDPFDENLIGKDSHFTVEHYATRFSRAGKKQLGESMGWGAFFIGLAIVLFFGLYFLSPAVGGERSIGYEALNPGSKIMGIYSGTVDENGKGALSLDSITGMHVDSAKMTISGKSIILQGDIKRKGAEKFALTLMPVATAAQEDPLYGEYTLELNLKKHTCTGRFIPTNPDKNGDIVPRTIAFTTADEEGAAAASKPAETKKTSSKKSSKKKAAEPAAATSAPASAAAEEGTEAAEKVSSGGFKLEPVDEIPGGSSAQEKKEETKTEQPAEEKKERKPLKTPPGGF